MIETHLLMALVTLLVCMGWYPCCCDSSGCEYCSTTPASASVTLSGWAANTCTNLWMNITFTLPFGGACNWLTAGTNKCTTLGMVDIQWSINVAAMVLGSGNYGLRATVSISKAGTVQTVIYEWDSGGTSPFDCSATRTLSLVSNTGGSWYDPSSSACQFN